MTFNMLPIAAYQAWDMLFLNRQRKYADRRDKE
jgi:hypothetical protein